MNAHPPEPSRGEILVYEDPDGAARVDVRLERDTVWLSQQQMADLFGRDQSVVARHLQSVFEEAELAEASNMHFLHITGTNKPEGFCSWFGHPGGEGQESRRTIARTFCASGGIPKAGST